jgi:hypothetical protein
MQMRINQSKRTRANLTCAEIKKPRYHRLVTNYRHRLVLSAICNPIWLPSSLSSTKLSRGACGERENLYQPQLIIIPRNYVYEFEVGLTSSKFSLLILTL